MFIDGSLVDNLPVGLMAGLGEGPVIAVDVKATSEHAEGGRASAGPPRPPSLAETLTRVLLLGSANTSEAALPACRPRHQPAGAGVALLEFHQIDEAREAGRVAARDALDQAPGALFA